MNIPGHVTSLPNRTNLYFSKDKWMELSKGKQGKNTVKTWKAPIEPWLSWLESWKKHFRGFYIEFSKLSIILHIIWELFKRRFVMNREMGKENPLVWVINGRAGGVERNRKFPFFYCKKNWPWENSVKGKNEKYWNLILFKCFVNKRTIFFPFFFFSFFIK